jgi:hypothetical protein
MFELRRQKRVGNTGYIEHRIYSHTLHLSTAVSVLRIRVITFNEFKKLYPSSI